MDWIDVENILYEGTKEQMEKISCPDCGGVVSFSYYHECSRFVTKCESCGYLSIGHGLFLVPNCYKFYGIEHTFEQNKNNSETNGDKRGTDYV